jgi:hypothetical protein
VAPAVAVILLALQVVETVELEVVLVVPEAVVHGMDVAVQMIFVEKSML